MSILRHHRYPFHTHNIGVVCVGVNRISMVSSISTCSPGLPPLETIIREAIRDRIRRLDIENPQIERMDGEPSINIYRDRVEVFMP